MKVLDLFSGMGCWSHPWLDRGHTVVSLDIDSSFNPTVCGDILDPDVVEQIKALGPYDVILASPPCESFSVASIGRHWVKGETATPKTDKARHGLKILKRTLTLISELNPSYWLMENPCGKMRKTAEVQDLNRWSVTYCQYGDDRMKPTDLWGVMPASWTPRPMCAKGAPYHTAAPRGSHTGTQGRSSYLERSLIPLELTEEVCVSILEDS